MRLVRTGEFKIEPIPPFSFRLTVRKPAGWDLFTPYEAYEKGMLWTGIRFHRRPIGLKITSMGKMRKPRLHVSVYARAALSKRVIEELHTCVAQCLGAGQDLREFYGFAARDSILKHAVKDLYGMHDTQTVSLINPVVLSICLQMARPKRSREMLHSINRNHGDTIEFDRKEVLLQPSAERLAKLRSQTFAKECKLGYRAKYIVASAKMIAGGFPQMHKIMTMLPVEAKAKLMELPGIGDYAADIINPHAGFPIDAWSVDVFGMLFFGKEPKNRRDAIEKVKGEGLRRWGPWSWMAFFYVVQDLQNLSKRLDLNLRPE